MPGLEPGIQGNRRQASCLDRRVKPGDDVNRPIRKRVHDPPL